MEAFRFGIMGAGSIAVKFCEAVSLIPGCEVAAVASKSAERAERFAGNNRIRAYYDSYERMLAEERPDCVYLAVTPDDHYRLSMLCLEHGIPVLCEKAMFLNSSQAEAVFDLSKEKGIFVMEAMWSRFLPAVRKAKEWLEEGRIGRLSFAELAIGFLAPADASSRYLNPALGGGAAFDVTVYAYELADFFLDQPVEEMTVAAVWGPTGVDLTDHVTLRCRDCAAALTGSFAAGLEERAVLYGERGKIVVPHPHYASEAFLYPADGGESLHFRDQQTRNGFVYEIREVMVCIRAGKRESTVVPHSLTLNCARMFDRIMETKRL